MQYRFNKNVLDYAQTKNNSEKNLFLKIVDSNINEAISRDTLYEESVKKLASQMAKIHSTIAPKNLFTSAKYHRFEAAIDDMFDRVYPLLMLININEDNLPFISNGAISIIVETEKDKILVVLPFNKWHKLSVSESNKPDGSTQMIMMETLQIVIMGLEKLLRDPVTYMTPFGIVRKEVEMKIGDKDILSAVKGMVKKRRMTSIKGIKVFTGYSKGRANVFDDIKIFKKVPRFMFKRDFSLPYHKKSLNDKVNMGVESLEVIPKNYIKEILKYDEIVLHRPYHQYITHKLLKEAATDPNVLSIRQTIYRLNEDSQILDNLILAAKNGKDVFVIIEPRARFDEENNIKAIEKLLEFGVTIVPGIREFKTHAKLLQIVLFKKGKTEIITNISTGNFNENTAKLYEDFDYFTTDIRVAKEVSMLFNLISGIDVEFDESRLITSPNSHIKVINHINNAKEVITIKVNHLGDPEIIEALRKARDERGVKVNLIVRSINDALDKPDMPRLNSITVVGDILEHSRIYKFDDKIFIGSSDLLMRNTRRRYECMVNITNDANKAMLNDILDIYIKNANRPFSIQKEVEKYHKTN